MSRGPIWGQDFVSIRAEHLRSRQLYTDSDFPPCTRSLYREHTKYTGTIVWKRPGEIVARPEFIVDGASRHDLDQGGLGNCWFIAGATALAASYPRAFERVLPLDQGFQPHQYTGMFHFNFWWFGEWKEVIIDDYLPTDGRRLVYCKCDETSNEFWPCLLEKAYAKLHGSYEQLNGGLTQNAMVDLTGGISEVIDISNNTKVNIELYDLLYTSYNMASLMGASIHKHDKSNPNEEELPNGLHNGHAYSITGFYRKLPSDPRHSGLLLLRLRNPWGKWEWKGPWSDRSPQMRDLSPEMRHDLEFTDKDDGEFWISFEDFVSNFDEIQLCHLYPEAFIDQLADTKKKQQWIATVCHGSWVKGVSAGGCGNAPDRELFWKNPQFQITLRSVDATLGSSNTCTLIVSLMKKEKNHSTDIAIGFKVYELTNPQFQNTMADKNSLQFVGSTGEFVERREMTKRFQLPPGTYVVIPSTYSPRREAEFILRMFTEQPVDAGYLDVSTHIPLKPSRMTTKDLLSDTFDRHAGSDRKMDASEFRGFLMETASTELQTSLQFPLESCRTLLALMDEDKSGFLSFDEARRAWKEIKAYVGIFQQFDRNNTNSVDTYELRDMFQRLGFTISTPVLTSIVRRYGGRDRTITMEDFIMAICKLTSLFGSFQEEQRSRGVGGEAVVFTMNKFLEVTMLL